MLGVRKLTGRTVPIYILQSGSGAGTLFLFGPEYLGGNGDLEKKLKPTLALEGEKRDEEAERVNKLQAANTYE